MQKRPEKQGRETGNGLPRERTAAALLLPRPENAWEGQVTGLASRRDRRRKEGWLSVLFGRSREENRRERAPRPAPQPERDPIEERRRILRESGPVTGNRRPYSFQIDADAFRSERPSQPAARPANPQTARTQTASPRSQTRSQPARPPQPRTTWPQPVETSRPAQNRTTWPRPVQTARPQQAPASRPQAQRPAAHEVLPEPYRSYYAKVPKKPYYPVAVPRPKPEPERPRPASYSVSEVYGAPRCENSGFVEAPVPGSARPLQEAPAVVSAPCPQPAAPVPEEAPVSIWDRLQRAAPVPSDRPAPLVRLSSEPMPEASAAPAPVLPAPAAQQEECGSLKPEPSEAEPAFPQQDNPAAELPQSPPFEPPILPPSGPGRYVYVDNSDDWDEDPFFTSWDMEQFPEEDFPDEAEEDSGEDEGLSGPDEETGSLLPAAETNETTGAAGQQLTPNPDTPDGQQLTPNPDTPDGLLTTGSGAPEPAGSPALSAPRDSSSPAPAPQTPPQAAAQPVRPAPKQPTAVLPALPTSFLTYSPEPDMDSVEEELNANGEKLIETLQSFGVRATMLEACRGPAVTRYELQPAAGVKISKITNLADDIAMNLAALGVRIEAPIPGKAAVGIEVPNRKVSVVRMRELIESPAFRRAESPLTTVLGRDIAGELVLADLGKMPHLLIAGSTGSGKSVCINSLIVSLLYKSTPQEVRFLMIDPKVVELGIYNGIPHLIVPVVTDPRKAAGALNWAVTEMLRRYQQFAANNVRDLASYNRLAGERGYIDEQGMRMEHMPQIVIIIDELADLMMAAPNEVEDSICRLAQMARAAGMHLVIATQRPSVDVITGIIKANIPSRIAFAVSSQVDSRTILDMGGAEKLLGRGDMLFSPLGVQKPMRVQGCFIDDREIEAVVDFIRKAASAEYDESVMEEIERGGAAEQTESSEEPEGDPMIPEAVRCVVEAGQASTSLLQRRLRLGYARAGRLVDEMEQMGIVGPHEGSKPRQVLISWQQYLEMAQNRGWES